MPNKYLLYIDTALVVNETFSQFVKNNTRREQIMNGLRILFQYNFAEKGCDVLFSDNTITELDSDMLALFPPNTTFRCFQDNPFGHLNKGAGLMQKWLYNKSILDTYEYIIHFEGRLTLNSHSFFNTFFSNPRTLYRDGSPVESDYTTVFTGLFACKPSLLWKTIETYPIQKLVKEAISIEFAMRPFFVKEDGSEELHHLDLRWHCFNGLTYDF